MATQSRTSGAAISASLDDPGERACWFINKLTHTGDYSGRPFDLRPWQSAIVRKIFGTLKPDGFRQYRKVFVALPRKQGKTELAAAILLYLLVGAKKGGQQLYSASGDRKQAALIFDAAAAMVRNDPYLSKLCTIYDSYKKLIDQRTDSYYEALSSDAPGKHGLGPSVVLFDEVHVLPDHRLHDNLTTGFGARKEPLIIYITTAGYDRFSLCYELWQYALAVKNGLVKDETFLPVIYAADPEDDWRDEATWYKAMPGLGDFCELEQIRDEFKKCTSFPAYENTFKQLYLNLWTEQAKRWLSTDLWAKCGTLRPEDFAGRECFGGLDLGITGDMAAFAMVFPNEIGGFDVDFRYWVPKHGKWREEPQNSELYRLWEQSGHLIYTGNSDNDLDAIETDIVALNELYPFRNLFADKAYARAILYKLYNVHGLPVKEFSQSPTNTNEPMKKLESMLVDGKIRHAGNPVAAWNVANAVMRRNPTGLMILDKSQETRRMDGLSALIDALAASLDPDAAGGPSVYETRGILRPGDL